MELLCNLGWLAITIAFGGFWCAQRRQAKRRSLLPAIAVQLISLFALTTILLPVISISDDLQASNNPAEVERSAGKRNQLLCAHHVPHGVAGIIAIAVSGLRPPLLRRLAFLTDELVVPAQRTAQVLAQWSRPPPAA
jgi:hypothetical protein